MKGKYIILEGIDGSGKSTISQILLQDFSNANINCVLYCEPTKSSPFAKEIRTILGSNLDSNNEIDNKLKELFLKDRMWNMEHQVKPSLDAGKTVLQDRSFYSTAAYQGRNFEEVKEIIVQYREIENIIKPDLVLFLDIDPEVALNRVSNRNEKKEIFEKLETLKKISAYYKYIWKEFSDEINCVAINTKNPLDEIIKVVKEKIMMVAQ